MECKLDTCHLKRHLNGDGRRTRERDIGLTDREGRDGIVSHVSSYQGILFGGLGKDEVSEARYCRDAIIALAEFQTHRLTLILNDLLGFARPISPESIDRKRIDDSIARGAARDDIELCATA